MERRKRVGYWINDRKAKKLGWADVLDEFRVLSLDAVKIDLTKPLEHQGPFDVILHKLTDFIAQGDAGDEDARKLVSNLESYAAAHPDVIIIDPVPCLRTVIDRFKTYSLINDYISDGEIFVPSFLVLENNNLEKNLQLLARSKVTFPMVCKPIVAHGSSAAHEVGPKPSKPLNLHVMTLVFNNQGLSECTFPCVVQSFVNHSAVLYKLFALGENYIMVERPSIKNLSPSPDAKPIHFHSGDISKPTSSSCLTVQEDTDGVDIPQNPAASTLKRIVSKTNQVLNLGLFGIDVVVEESTKRLAIIDVNCFPGYDGVEDFPRQLAAFIRSEVDRGTKMDIITNGCVHKDYSYSSTYGPRKHSLPNV